MTFANTSLNKAENLAHVTKSFQDLCDSRELFFPLIVLRHVFTANTHLSHWEVNQLENAFHVLRQNSIYTSATVLPPPREKKQRTKNKTAPPRCCVPRREKKTKPEKHRGPELKGRAIPACLRKAGDARGKGGARQSSVHRDGSGT